MLLHDTLLNSTTLQQELLDIFIRFRTYQVVLTSDIEKMYRQVNIYLEHRNVQQRVQDEGHTYPKTPKV